VTGKEARSPDSLDEENRSTVARELLSVTDIFHCRSRSSWSGSRRTRTARSTQPSRYPVSLGTPFAAKTVRHSRFRPFISYRVMTHGAAVLSILYNPCSLWEENSPRLPYRFRRLTPIGD
jgi:hypothetical protein